VCVGEGEIPRMGSPWTWGNIGVCVGVTCGLQRKENGQRTLRCCSRKKKKKNKIIEFAEGRENLSCSVARWLCRTGSGSGLIFFHSFSRSSRSSRTLFFFGGETCAKWGIFAIMDTRLVRMR
jgi:hypothetical protein